MAIQADAKMPTDAQRRGFSKMLSCAIIEIRDLAYQEKSPGCGRPVEIPVGRLSQRRGGVGINRAGQGTAEEMRFVLATDFDSSSPQNKVFY
jgi:hypothetical protein